MSAEVQQVQSTAQPYEGDFIVNDFQIKVGTINGTGSQTANTTLIRALFRMGIPVNGKNLFPSNIQGLPTWFFIRLSDEGYVARRENYEVAVAMNRSTAEEDIAGIHPGGFCIYPEEWKLQHDRDDIVYYPTPIKALVKEVEDVPSNLRDYVANMAYVGALAAILDIELEEIESALSYHFGGKSKPIKLNMDMVRVAYDYSKANHVKQDPFKVERMDKTEGKIMIDGNSAGGLGAVFGGFTLAAWYPITPSTSLIDAVRDYASNLRHDPETGEATYAIVQAEDELAAIGMILGAGWAGSRAMTATSGPGVSLMGEFAGMAYFAEIPAVVWDVQRVGPSTGLPTRTAQSDLMFAYMLGHGDTRHIVLLPSNVEECFEFGWRSFDIAERLQTLVFVLSDLDLGMNLWMGEPFQYPDEPMDRGKVLTKEDLEKFNGDWARYRDVDGDGIPYRTIPGTDHPAAAYFTRGTGHNENAVYSEKSEDWVANMERLQRKHRTAAEIVPQPVADKVDGAKIGIIAYGSVDPAIVEGRDRLKEAGIETSYLRIRALPLNETTREFIEQHDRTYVIEMNHEGQLANLIRIDFPELATKIIPLPFLDGLPLTARYVTETIADHEGK